MLSYQGNRGTPRLRPERISNCALRREEPIQMERILMLWEADRVKRVSGHSRVLAQQLNPRKAARCCWLCVLLRLPRKLAYGKIEIETCAFAGFACDLDIPTMGFDNALTDGKAQARAFALFAFVLCRKE